MRWNSETLFKREMLQSAFILSCKLRKMPCQWPPPSKKEKVYRDLGLLQKSSCPFKCHCQHKTLRQSIKITDFLEVKVYCHKTWQQILKLRCLAKLFGNHVCKDDLYVFFTSIVLLNFLLQKMLRILLNHQQSSTFGHAFCVSLC